MADDKEHLARMLNALADGEHHDEPREGHEQDSIEHVAPAPAGPPKPAGSGVGMGPKPIVPAPVVQGGAPRPKAVPNPDAPRAPVPVAQVRPRPAMPQPKPAGGGVKKVAVTPMTPAGAAQSPPANVRPSTPGGSVPAAGPAARPVEEQVVYEQAVEEGSEDEVAAGYENRAQMQADDQMMMPAVSAEVLAYKTPRVAPRSGHLVQRLNFKQTLIPICLTLAVVCGGFVLIGMMSGPESPYAAFGRTGIAVSFGVVALVMLGVGVVTMLQVQAELGKK